MMSSTKPSSRDPSRRRDATPQPAWRILKEWKLHCLRDSGILFTPMGKKPPKEKPVVVTKPGKPSALLDTRVIYCGDNLEQLARLPDACVDLIYIDPAPVSAVERPFNSNRNYQVFWGERKEKRAFEDRHASTHAYIDNMRPRSVELARVIEKTGSFYYHCGRLLAPSGVLRVCWIFSSRFISAMSASPLELCLGCGWNCR